MRDPKRIQELLGLVNEIWLKAPDLRFNQLIYILQSEYVAQNSGVGQIKKIEAEGFERVGFDLFNVEDDSFLDYLRTKVSNESNT